MTTGEDYRQEPPPEERVGAEPEAEVESAEVLYVYLSAADRVGEKPDKQQDEGYALPMAGVREIIRPPVINRVPLGGQHLLGVTNLRGQVLPVVSLRRLVGLDGNGESSHSRIVVLRGEQPLGLWVDWVEKVDQVPVSRIDTSDLVRRKATHSLLAGFVRPNPEASAGESRLRRLLDIKALHDASLAQPIEVGDARAGAGARSQKVDEEATVSRQFICFELGAQQFALDIGQVKEVVRVPPQKEPVSGMPEHVTGLMSLRDLMIPLIQMARLFELGEKEDTREARVVVVPVGARDGDAFLGLVVDCITTVVSRFDHHVQAVPETLASTPGFADIQGMLRIDDQGDQFAALLDVRRLLTRQAFQAATEALETTDMSMQEHSGVEDDRQIVVFKLADEEYGVAIEATKEILRVPETLTRVPKADYFIEGVINLRGMVLPVIDLRRRFELPTQERNVRQRIVVLNLNGQRTGFIVDAVHEVLRLPQDAIQTAPPLSPEQSTLITEMANLAADERMILLLDTGRLISEQESRTLQQVTAEQSEQKAS